MDRFPEKILLATEGSEDAALAGRAAADLSRRTGAQLHVVHAWQADMRRAYEVTLPVSLREWCEQKAAELLAKEVKRIEEADGKLVEAAGDEASTLIAVGSRGFGPIGRARLGSVSTILGAARGPVLVYPHHRN